MERLFIFLVVLIIVGAVVLMIWLWLGWIDEYGFWEVAITLLALRALYYLGYFLSMRKSSRGQEK